MDPLTSFHLVSLDVLKLIAYKKANNFHKEAEVLQTFYDHVLNITTESSQELHVRKLNCATEHCKAKILEQELKYAYNEIFKRDQKLAIELITKSVMPTKKQLTEEVILK